jgi:hypothetical protein
MPALPALISTPQYDAHLEQVTGLALGTRQSYRRMARRFITSCFGAKKPDWQTLTAPMITAFVTQEAAKCQGYGRKAPSYQHRLGNLPILPV